MHGKVCYLYYFTCGSYLEWAFWPNHPLFGYSWIQCYREEITNGSFRGLRYSVLGHEDLWGFRLTGVVVSRIWAIWWKDICNVGYAIRNAGWAATRVVAEGRVSCEGSFCEYAVPSSAEGRALRRVFGVAYAVGVT